MIKLLHIAAIAGFGLLLLQAFLLYLFGQPWICECGSIQFWEGEVLSSGNSQHLFDWYTFSHVIHGIAFYAILSLLLPRTSFATRLAIAIGLEVGWEVIENTPWLIEKYREQALAQGYTGDSIINSIMDTVAMIGGFVLTRRMPVSLAIALVIIFELYVGYMIHDNLSLNILNFIHPFESITAWQAGG